MGKGKGFKDYRTWWGRERAKRLAALADYLKDNAEEFNSFRTAPLAIKQNARNLVGIQIIVFRLLPEIFPDIWEPQKEKMLVVGFGPDPFDPRSVMPLGQGFALSNPFVFTPTGEPISSNYVTFTCMGCHSGGVRTSHGKLIQMVGSPTPLGNFFGKLNQTVNDPRYTAKNFQRVLNSKPFGWVYGFNPAFAEQELLERRLFNIIGGAEYFLGEVKLFSNGSQMANENTLGKFTYNIPNPPLAAGMPGSLDVFSLGSINLCQPDTCCSTNSCFDNDPIICRDVCNDKDFFPPAPGPADLPAAWEIQGRPRYQWDDSILRIPFREVAASSSVTAGDPAAVNLNNVTLSGQFIEKLPSFPYPFRVNRRSARRGGEIYQQACAGCHEPGNNVLTPPEIVGTDPNRAKVFTPGLVKKLTQNLRNSCTIQFPKDVLNPKESCFEPDGRPFPNDEILAPTEQYIQIPLAGVWATAPYLHNGSVPTLYHLVKGERPSTFYRGNFTYDKKIVGFSWKKPEKKPGLATLYDTSKVGYSNTGHTGSEFNGGIDWAAEPKKLWDLLEYLKTL